MINPFAFAWLLYGNSSKVERDLSEKIFDNFESKR
jgi:hypothetical protein